MDADWLGGTFVPGVWMCFVHVLGCEKPRFWCWALSFEIFKYQHAQAYRGVFYSRAHWMSCLATGQLFRTWPAPEDTEQMGKLLLFLQTLVYHILPFSFKQSGGHAACLYIFAHSLVRLESFIVTFILLSIRRVKITEWHQILVLGLVGWGFFILSWYLSIEQNF